MPPIRRYLRITKFSVLECRIYLDNPALAQSWLLNSRDQVLPRVIEAVRPLVLPKLREERERERSKKKNKKRSIKDVVTADDFEVSIFLTETETRHSLLAKHKHFRDKTQTKLTSNSTKLTGVTSDAPIDVDGDLPADSDVPILRREESDEDAIFLSNIPAIDAKVPNEETNSEIPIRRPKRRRSGAEPPSYEEQISDEEHDVSDQDFDVTGDDTWHGASSDEDVDPDVVELGRPPPPKRRRGGREGAVPDAEQLPERDDKKKMAMDISYEGFAIYGRVLCLVVKKRDGSKGGAGPSSGPSAAPGRPRAGQPGGQAVMENWITSTQMQPAAEEIDAP